MTRRERLMATLRGEAVDRPPVCFYEINGYSEKEDDPDPFNIYNHPSWKPLLKLARERTDRIVMCWVPFVHEPGEMDKRTQVTTYYDEMGRRHTVTKIQAGSRVLTQHVRKDPEVNTNWTLEHFIKDEEDLEAWINLPDEETGEPDYRELIQTEKDLGDSGIVSLETGDGLCEIANMMDMEDYMVLAMMEQDLFERAVQKMHRLLKKRIARVAKDFPGRLWRIYGPEYAAPPYLPPALYEKYVTKYDKELVELIAENGGYPRIHQHGRQKDILDYTIQTGCMAIDPIEPEPQGDVTLSYVREKYGKQLVLFGNLEISDLVLLEPEAFREKVRRVLKEGTQGEGRGFVLMPSSCLLGREVPDKAYRNYEIMVEMAEAFRMEK